ncbi:hypothetical protein [Streptomyces sp. 35G-GA-8]|uniref:hypothetical protein n=1 Tax=Streptomyces sp. 35G-GA-8 TaxID=2939434 RepID=UPI00201EC47B|nr:hypothetical protein [Streptomyces sp. 35G-GA-8]MCL7377453.1 hypothetical protein [Streptomyces sp. 35G-GA-8]
MEDQPEEVQRLLEAIAALEGIKDDAACASAVTQVLNDWPDLHSRLREIRQQRVQALKAQGKTWKEIAEILGGIHPTRAQQIGAGLRGSKRPLKKEPDGG